MPLIDHDLYRFDDFELQPSTRSLLRSGQKLPLTPKTFEVLVCLVSNAGRVVLKDELLSAVWPDAHVEQSNLTQHIFWLRKFLGDRASYITTIPGRGYQFTGRVVTVAEPSQILQPPVGNTLPGGGDSHVLHRLHERTRISIEETIYPQGLAAQEPSPASSAWELPLAARLPLALGAPAAMGRRLGLWIAAGVVLVSIAAWGLWHRAHRAVAVGDHHEVVLAGFQNSTGDPVFDHTLNTLLTIDLSQSPFLVVAGSNETRQILKLMNHAPDEALTPPVAREVCQRMNDEVVLDGTISNFGRKYLLTLTATDCARGKDLLQTKSVANDREDVLRAVDSVAAEMRTRLGEPLPTQAPFTQPLQREHTFSLDALKVYSQAHDLELEVRYQEALPLYQRAVELDPKFAAAYLGLAHCYGRFGENKLSREAIIKAYDLRDQADDLLRLNIVSYYNSKVTGDVFAIIRNLQAWTDMYPLQAEPWAALANIQHSLGRTDLAIEPARRSLALDPNNGYAYEVLAGSLLNHGDVQPALDVCNEAIRRHLDGRDIHVLLFHIGALQHNAAAIAAQVEWAKGRDSEPQMTVEQAYFAFSQGRARDGIALWLRMVQLYRDQGLPERAEHMLAGLPRREAQLGLLDQARTQLRSAKDVRDTLDYIIPLAQTGEPDVAEAALDHEIARSPTDKSLQVLEFTKDRAAIELARHKPLAAVAALEPAIPYDLSGLELMEIRGQAYLEARQPALAAEQYRKILDHPFVSPLSPTVPLAHLGLARALGAQGDIAGSRAQYQAFLTLWKDADSDVPPLLQARQELAELH